MLFAVRSCCGATNLRLWEGKSKYWAVTLIKFSIWHTDLQGVQQGTTAELCTQLYVLGPYRINTASKEKGWGRHFFHQIEPNWPLPYNTVPVPRLGDTRLAGWVTFCSIFTSIMPRAQNRAGRGSIILWKHSLSLSFYYLSMIRAKNDNLREACCGAGGAEIILRIWSRNYLLSVK